MKRRWLKLLVVFAGLGLGALYLWLGPSGGINRMSVLRIRVGMSAEAVDAVIGLPHGEYSSPKSNGTVAMYFGACEEIRFWYGNTGTIVVSFDNHHKVTERHFSPSSLSFFDKFYQWIGID